jgi:hypothetical protein
MEYYFSFYNRESPLLLSLHSSKTVAILAATYSTGFEVHPENQMKRFTFFLSIERAGKKK